MMEEERRRDEKSLRRMESLLGEGPGDFQQWVGQPISLEPGLYEKRHHRADAFALFRDE